jgi:hypothetical protein
MSQSTNSPIASPSDMPDFDALALLVLNNEATPEEKARFDELILSSQDAQARFSEFKETYQFLRENAPLSKASRMSEPSLPEYRMNMLRTAVRQTFKNKASGADSEPSFSWNTLAGLLRPFTLIAGFAVVALILGILLWRTPNSSHKAGGEEVKINGGFLVSLNGNPKLNRAGQDIPTSKTTSLIPGDKLELKQNETAALVSSKSTSNLTGPHVYIVQPEQKDGVLSAIFLHHGIDFLSDIPLVVQRGASRVSIYSPQGFTRRSPLLLICPTEAGKTYDVKISNDVDTQQAAITFKQIIPPFDFDKAQKEKNENMITDGFYKLTLFESGNPIPLSESHFQLARGSDIKESPMTDLEKIEEARQALVDTSPRMGDALADLMELSPEMENSELVLRMKLFAFGQLGLEQEFRVLKQQIASLSNSSQTDSH